MPLVASGIDQIGGWQGGRGVDSRAIGDDDNAARRPSGRRAAEHALISPSLRAGGPEGPPALRRTLIVTNDFPPRTGGIQTFVWECALRQPPGSVVVYASRSPGWEEFDAQAPFPIVRDRSSMLLPTRRVARAVA